MYFSKYTIQLPESVLEDFNTDYSCGLSEQEVGKRRRQYGNNTLPNKRASIWQIALRQFYSSFVFLLLAASLLAFLLGEIIDGVMILLFVLINAVLGFYQENKSEHTAKLLNKYISHKALVRRSGTETMVFASDLVPGDIVLFKTGDIIPADLRVLKEHDLEIDESVLTGESAPVKKVSSKLPHLTKEIFHARNIAFSGTIVKSGKGEGLVLAIGKQTVVGQLAKLTMDTDKESSFTVEIDRFSKFILKLVLLTIGATFILNLFLKSGNIQLFELIIFIIALAVSIIPEALLVVTTFSLSRGALHLARNNVIVKRLSAIEDLGGIEVLCTDKTGTITENKLSVENIFSSDKEKCLNYANLCCAMSKDSDQAKDSFDIAIINDLKSGGKEIIAGYQILAESPFSPAKKRNSVLIKKDGQLKIIIRGAPEILLDYSNNVNPETKEAIEKWIINEGERGNRVLAVAGKQVRVPEDYSEKIEENGLDFLGVISFGDTIKTSTREALQKAERLGVKIKIISGDSPEVTGTVAMEVGIITKRSELIMGENFEQMPEADQITAVDKYDVFSRFTPEQKFRVIELLQKKYRVGFLGEGINDAPALMAANVSLVVDSAADVARDAADIVLLEKSLGAIVYGIQEGREVYANIIKYIRATLTTNFGNYYAVAVASFFFKALPILPLQILLVNLLSDFPMIAISTDRADFSELTVPQKYDIKKNSLLAAILGVIYAFFVFAIFVIFRSSPPPVLQTMWFAGGMVAELVFLYSIRTTKFFLLARKPSLIMLSLSFLVAAFTIVLPFTSVGRDIFNFTAPTIRQLALLGALVTALFIAMESTKLLYYKIIAKK